MANTHDPVPKLPATLPAARETSFTHRKGQGLGRSGIRGVGPLILTDVFNALGWDNGLRTATKTSLAADAWRYSSPTSAFTVCDKLSQHY